MRRSVWSTCAAVLALAAVAAPLASGASECAACQYQARNCSSSSASSASYSAVAGDDDGDGVDVCDAAGDIQFDDVFCDDDACDCASPRQCVSLVVGCTNLFQARSRKRCLGNDSIQLKFDRCAVNQGITDLDATNMASDWIFFKQFSQCVSSDCLATRQFHLSGLVQCGHMLAAWKDQNSSSNSTAASASTYHFIVDGSRASDLSAGTFHYSVPYDAASGALLYASSAANSTRIDKCYSLQTRNQKNSTTGTCDGVYLVRDTTTQLANTDDYDISKLTWPVYIGVVGSVAVAVGSIAAVATVFYRLKRAEKEANAAGCSGELLSDLDGVNDSSNHDSPVSGGERDIRQRSRESEDAEEKDAAVL